MQEITNEEIKQVQEPTPESRNKMSPFVQSNTFFDKNQSRDSSQMGLDLTNFPLAAKL